MISANVIKKICCEYPKGVELSTASKLGRIGRWPKPGKWGEVSQFHAYCSGMLRTLPDLPTQKTLDSHTMFCLITMSRTLGFRRLCRHIKAPNTQSSCYIQCSCSPTPYVFQRQPRPRLATPVDPHRADEGRGSVQWCSRRVFVHSIVLCSCFFVFVFFVVLLVAFEVVICRLARRCCTR